MPLIMSSPTSHANRQPQSPAPPARPISPSIHPQQRSIPLPLTPHTTLHMQITSLEISTMIFLTTTDPSNSSSLSALGSFVYSMPNVCLTYSQANCSHADIWDQRFQPTEPLSTPLYAVPGSIDFATRVAKTLARRTGKPAYVGCSAVFGNYGIEEEMAGVKAAIEGIMSTLGEKME